MSKNVIDITSRLKSQKEGQAIGSDTAKVVDITEMREAMLQQDRRKVKRTILTEFIGVHAVVPGQGLVKVTLYDINETGLAFDLEMEKGEFPIGEEVAMRVYMNHQTYFPFEIKIRHVQDILDEGVRRHGCQFIAGTLNDVALHHFVKFIENVSASLRSDHGDVMVSKINS